MKGQKKVVPGKSQVIDAESYIKHLVALGERLKKARKAGSLRFAEIGDVTGYMKREIKDFEAGQIDLQRDFVCGMMLLGVSPAWLLAGVKPKLIPGHPTMMVKERDKAYIRIGRSVDKYFASIEKKGLAGNVKPYVKWPEGCEASIRAYLA